MTCFHFDGDPIYDTDDDSRIKSVELLPLEKPSFSHNFHDHFQPYVYTNDVDFWQHEEDMLSDFFQPTMDDLLQPFHTNFRSHSVELLQLRRIFYLYLSH
jgi:hypothetical protein